MTGLQTSRADCYFAEFNVRPPENRPRAEVAADMGTGSPLVLDAGAIFWMVWCRFAALSGACEPVPGPELAFNRAAEECLPTGEYLPLLARHHVTVQRGQRSRAWR
jgi:hypothetical protein